MPDFGRWTSNGGDPSLNEINRTDRFLDALAFEQPVYATDPGEAELINLLSGWRDQATGVTLSAGAAVHTATRGPSETFRAADQALYEAKRLGRDRIVLESADAPVEELTA